MIDIELAEIEDRISAYPPEAQADIRWLMRELRRADNLGLRNPDPPASAIYDPLTVLLSGGAYGVRFSMARARARRYQKMFAVISIDLTLNKSVVAGTLDERDANEMLKRIAERLVAGTRATDTLARVDHEKFAMILEELTCPEHAERVKQNIETALAEPIPLEERAVRANASVSLQFYPTSRLGDPNLH